MRLSCFFIPLALVVSPVPASAQPAQDKLLRQVEAALSGGRLIQARRMLARAQADPAQPFRFELAWAELLLAEGAHVQALARFTELSGRDPSSARAATGAGLAALGLGNYPEASRWLVRATSLEGADWRAWNGLGVASDFQRDWTTSDAAYRKAVAAAPAKAAVWNNYGYSLLCQRRLSEAANALRHAAALAPTDARIATNLELANALAGQYPAARAKGETLEHWAARLNNAGYSAWLAGDKAAARSLLSKAIQASGVRFERAEANLRLVEGE